MIEQTTVNGRDAMVAYFDADMEPTDKESAVHFKIVFVDGEDPAVIFASTEEPNVESEEDDYSDLSEYDDLFEKDQS
jgi:hypothetical protein